MNLLVSALVSVYNAEAYIRECLDSIHEQTFKVFEAICIDDGSTDASGMILDEYSEMDKNFRLFSLEEMGI